MYVEQIEQIEQIGDLGLRLVHALSDPSGGVFQLLPYNFCMERDRQTDNCLYTDHNL